MPLGKVQTQIVANLEEMELITAAQREAIAAIPGEPTGDVLDKMLQDDYARLGELARSMGIRAE